MSEDGGDLEKELGEVVRRFVPRAVIERFEERSEFDLENKEDIKSSLATVAFFDITGFSTLATELEMHERSRRQKQNTNPSSAYLPQMNSMTASLGAGADALAEKLNAILRSLVDPILEFGGDIIKFAGDALIVLWEGERKDLPAIVAMTANCALFCHTHSIAQKDALRLHTGIGCGEVFKCHVGGEMKRWEFSIAGDANTQAALAEQAAETDEVVLSPASYAHLKELDNKGYVIITSQPVSNPEFADYTRITSIKVIKTGGPYKFPLKVDLCNINAAPVSEKIYHLTKAYIPRLVIEEVEVRKNLANDTLLKIAVVFFKLLDVEIPVTEHLFPEPETEASSESPQSTTGQDCLPQEKPFGGIAIDEEEDSVSARRARIGRKKRRKFLAQLQKSVKAVQQAAYSQYGTLRQFIIDDKGVVAIVVLGLPPHYFEDISARAVRVAANLICSNQIKASAGISTGTAYCGTIGSVYRAEYLVTGECIILAARLMSRAKPNTALCDEYTMHEARLNPYVKFGDVQKLPLKGYNTPVSAYYADLLSLATHINAGQRGYLIADQLRSQEGRFGGFNAIGQQKVKEDIFRSIFVDQEKPAKAVFLSGPSGSGKTHMTHWAINSCPKTVKHVFYATGDASEVEKKTPFYIWRPILLDILKLEEEDMTPTLPISAAAEAMMESPVRQVEPRTLQEIDTVAEDDILDDNLQPATFISKRASFSRLFPLAANGATTSDGPRRQNQKQRRHSSLKKPAGAVELDRENRRRSHGSTSVGTSILVRPRPFNSDLDSPPPETLSPIPVASQLTRSNTVAGGESGNLADLGLVLPLPTNNTGPSPPPSSANTPKDGTFARFQSKFSNVLTRSLSMGTGSSLGARKRFDNSSANRSINSAEPILSRGSFSAMTFEVPTEPSEIQFVEKRDTSETQTDEYSRNIDREDEMADDDLLLPNPPGQGWREQLSGRKPLLFVNTEQDDDETSSVGGFQRTLSSPRSTIAENQMYPIQYPMQNGKVAMPIRMQLSPSAASLDALLDERSFSSGWTVGARNSPSTLGMSRLRTGSNTSSFQAKPSADKRFLQASSHLGEQQIAEQSYMLKVLRDSGRVKYRRLSTLEFVLPGVLFADNPDALSYAAERNRIRSASEHSEEGVLNMIKSGINYLRPGSPANKQRNALDDETWDSSTPTSSIASIDTRDFTFGLNGPSRRYSQADKEDIIEVMLALLDETGKIGKTLIIIDDAHLMDQDSLDLLRRAIESKRIEIESFQNGEILHFNEEPVDDGGYRKRDHPNGLSSRRVLEKQKRNSHGRLELAGSNVRFLLTFKGPERDDILSETWKQLLSICAEEHDRVTSNLQSLMEESKRKKEGGAQPKDEDLLPLVRPAWACHIALDELSTRECVPFFSMHLGLGLSGELIRCIHRVAEGIPGSLLSVFNSLLEQQYINIDSLTGVATFVDGINDVAPEIISTLTLSGYVVSDIYKYFDSLGRVVQSILKIASAIGTSVPLEMLFFVYCEIAAKHNSFPSLSSSYDSQNKDGEGDQDALTSHPPERRKEGDSPITSVGNSINNLIVNPFDPDNLGAQSFDNKGGGENVTVALKKRSFNRASSSVKWIRKRLSTTDKGTTSENQSRREHKEKYRVSFVEAIDQLKDSILFTESKQETSILFKDDPTRCVIYNKMLENEKKEIHRQILQWYEENTVDGTRDHGCMGYHAMLSHQFLKAFAYFEHGIDSAVKMMQLDNLDMLSSSCEEIAASTHFVDEVLEWASSRQMHKNSIVNLFQAKASYLRAQFCVSKGNYLLAQQYLSRALDGCIFGCKKVSYYGRMKLLRAKWFQPKSQRVRNPFDIVEKKDFLEEYTFHLLSRSLSLKVKSLLREVEDAVRQSNATQARITKLFSSGW